MAIDEREEGDGAPAGRSARRVGELLERDGDRCVWCGREPWPGTATVDHVCPKSRGGTGELENLLLSCSRCNRTRRSRPVAAYLRERHVVGDAPREELVRAAIARLGRSSRRAHREYAAQQARHIDAAAADVVDGGSVPT